jgi:hypothetical protein
MSPLSNRLTILEPADTASSPIPIAASTPAANLSVMYRGTFDANRAACGVDTVAGMDSR